MIVVCTRGKSVQIFVDQALTGGKFLERSLDVAQCVIHLEIVGAVLCGLMHPSYVCLHESQFTCI